jgi:hypothetical protein
MLLTGNPLGAAYVASGAMSFAKGNGWQSASQLLGFAAAAGTLAGSGGSSGLSADFPGDDFPGERAGGLDLPMAVNALAGTAKSIQRDITDHPIIQHAKAWYQNRFREDLSLLKKVFLGGTINNAEIDLSDPTTLYLHADFFDPSWTPENRYSTLGHEFKHFADLKEMGVETFSEKFRYYNELGLREHLNPFERIAEHRGSVFATEYLSRPVRPGALYKVDNLR